MDSIALRISASEFAIGNIIVTPHPAKPLHYL
jgi:hypothetical protein